MAGGTELAGVRRTVRARHTHKCARKRADAYADAYPEADADACAPTDPA